VTTIFVVAVAVPPFASVAVAVMVTVLVCCFARLFISNETPLESNVLPLMVPSLAVYRMVAGPPQSDPVAFPVNVDFSPYAMVDGDADTCTVGGWEGLMRIVNRYRFRCLRGRARADGHGHSMSAYRSLRRHAE
jgi:hypothetical protein